MFRSGFLSFTLPLCLCCLPRDSLGVSALSQKSNSSYHELPPPVNLSLTSYNFKTTLTWAYADETSEKTNFTVQFRDYQTAQWQLFPPCSNIALARCDVTKAFNMKLTALNSYYAKVKAVTQFQESQFAFTERFCFKENATIGAPTVEVQVHGQQVILRCIYPVVAKLTTETGLKVNRDFRCNICIWQDGNNELKNCRIRKSRWKLNITQPRVTLCVSARVNSKQWKMKEEWSTQKCFKVQSLNLQETLIVLLAVVAFFLGFVTVSVLWKLLKKELVLPKSLMLIVKAINPYVDMKIEEDVSVVIKYEEVIPVECDHFFEEAARPISNPEITEPLTVDLKYAGKNWSYDRPQTLLNFH
uniref:interferon gamma receptor 1-like n=1 Tax=Pristiophorus japonicus TaxID=55135 RepID=UPI00398E4A68